MPAKIGTRRDAALAAAITYDQYNKTHVNLPEGWSVVGTGCSRVAFLSTSGVLYKIGYSKWEDDQAGMETRNQRTHAKMLPQGWRFPTTSVFTVNDRKVIAMQFISGGPVDWIEQRNLRAQMTQRYGSRWKIEDIGHDNCKVGADGINYIVDAAF